MPAWSAPWQWAAIVSQAARLGMEAQQVIGLRLADFASGRGTHHEMVRMVIEKPAAFAAAQMEATLALARGSKTHVAAGKALEVYSKKVRANRKRLRRD
jgi:hypothetical protein